MWEVGLLRRQEPPWRRVSPDAESQRLVAGVTGKHEFDFTFAAGNVMRIWVTAMVLSALVFRAGVAAAGVILQQEQVIKRASGTFKLDRTILLEGHRGKIVDKFESMVVDFDQARTLMIHPHAKNYYATGFPPPRLLATLITRVLVPPMVNYAKTGKRRTIAGYQCDEYSGSRKFATVTYDDVGCFSTEAPGAKEYDTFERGLIVKLDPDPKKPLSKLAVPDGIPLAIETRIEIGPNPPPAASERQATTGTPTPTAPKPAPPGEPKMPPANEVGTAEVVTLTVSSVKEQSISSAEFNPPAGYQKQRAPTMGLGH